MRLTLRKREGSPYWHARGTVPMRQANGTITRVRIEESTHETSKARAARAAADIAAHYHEQAYRPKPKSISFTDAAITYVESKNPSKRDRNFVSRLVAHFAELPISEIDQASIAAAAHSLYPGCSPSTHNRAVFAPTITILRLSGHHAKFDRPKMAKPSLTIPPEEWFEKFLASNVPPRLKALVAFCTLTGRRIGEACRIMEQDIDANGNVTIARTKTGAPIVVRLPDICRPWLAGIRSNPRSRSLFGYSNRHNVRRALVIACERAGLPYYPTHSFGRHAFASRLLKAGKSLKFVQEAGGWASIKMPADRYGHLEKSEVAQEVQDIAERWSRKR